MAPESADEAVGKLRTEERDVLKACVLAQMSVRDAVPEDVIAGQLDDATAARLTILLQGMSRRASAFVTLRGPQLWGFTPHGGLVAQRCLAQDGDVEPTTVGRTRRIRGNPRDAMKAYAEKIGGVYDPSRARCSNCHHDGTHMVRRNAQRLCQVCFLMDIRLW